MYRSLGKNGFGVVEVLIAASIIGASVFSFYYVFAISQRLAGESGNRIRANFLAEEGLEALRFLRDSGWNQNLDNLSPGTDYYISFDPNTSLWSVGVSDPGAIDGVFARKITVADVARDANANIVSVGGSDDPDTKKFTVEISWSERGAPASAVLSTYLSDIYNN